MKLADNGQIFGVDLLCSFPAGTRSSEGGELPIPTVTLLEYNASPDFDQSSDRLRPKLQELFAGVVMICVVPFFGLQTIEDEEESEGKGGTGVKESTEWTVGQSRRGWRMVGKAEVRGGY